MPQRYFHEGINIMKVRLYEFIQSWQKRIQHSRALQVPYQSTYGNNISLRWDFDSLLYVLMGIVRDRPAPALRSRLSNITDCRESAPGRTSALPERMCHHAVFATRGYACKSGDVLTSGRFTL